MNSTANSDVMLTVSHLKMHFELEHYFRRDLRDVFVEAATHPVDFFFKPKEIFYVLDDLNFTIHRGDRLGILGVNGTGKTTLCRCLARMMKPSSGKVITDYEVRGIFDTGSGVISELTGRENARLLARLFFPHIEKLDHFVDEAIEFSELGHFIDIPFRQYSKGMQTRLILSLISAVPTDILILDEVFDGADVFFQEKISRRMKDFIAKAGATIFVSHSVDQVRQVCNKVMVLDHGKITFLGDMEAGIDFYLHKKSPA